MPDPARSLADWLHWQETLHHTAIDLGLARVAVVAERLGLLTPACVTLIVGGTNGKGSTTHLLAAIYQAAGYRVGRYTSPHLLRYNERVVIDGVEASDAQLCAAFTAIEAQRGDTPLTYFEYGTLAALWLFAQAKVDVQVLEVGLGGRLDAVNMLDADAAIVTSIGIDHVQFLGADRDAIGREKAGIFRAGRPAIVGDLHPPQGLRMAAREAGVTLRCVDDDFAITEHADGFDWRDAMHSFHRLPLPGIAGAAQLRNAACVIAAVMALQPRLPVPEAAIRHALPKLRLPGRCEQRWQGEQQWIFDVAHNAEAAQVLADFLAAAPARAPTVCVLGMLDDKPHAQVIQTLNPHVDHWVLVSLDGARGSLAAQLRAHVPDAASVQCCDNMNSALAGARQRSGSTGRVVVTGSFVTVAAALTELERF